MKNRPKTKEIKNDDPQESVRGAEAVGSKATHMVVIDHILQRSKEAAESAQRGLDATLRKERVCRWDIYNSGSQTECGHWWRIEEGGPDCWDYCPNCGGKIVN